MTTSPSVRTRGHGHRAARLVSLVLSLGLLLTLAGCGQGEREHVTVMVPWTVPEEFQAFYALVKDFEHDTGIQVDVQVTRALTQQLDASVAAGAPPDLAVLPSVGAIAHYATMKGKGLQRLGRDTVDISAYLQPFRGLAQVRGATYAVPVKIDVKSLVWYESGATRAPPADGPGSTLDAFVRDAGLGWCLGLESGPTSGWPGADWIADILLAHSGTEAYTRWVSGRLSWKSKEVEEAWSSWHDRVGRKELKGASGQGFADATRAMAGPSPECRLAHGARSALSTAVQQDSRSAFVAPAPGRPVQVSGDFMGMFTHDNPGARAFVAYLAGEKAQQAWVDQPGPSAFSARTAVTRYPDPVEQRIAAMLQPQAHHTLCFSAADAMSPDVAAAFYRAVLDSADGTEDAGTLLGKLQKVQKTELGDSGVPEQSVCATPS